MKTLSMKKGVLMVIIISVILIIASVFAVWDLRPSADFGLSCGPGYIDVHSSSFSLIPFVNEDKHITSSEIATAFIGQIGSGNLTLNKQHGTSYGDTNVGVFTLGNGATAYVASTNSTVLVIQLKNGEYLIVGTLNTNAFASIFSQNVYPLKSPQG
jgi:hypothetical protein